MMRRLLALWMAVLALLATGCATVPPAGPEVPDAVAASPLDPWERWNRKVFAFNETLDKAIFAPVAEAYRDVVPSLVRTGVNNVFANINDAWSATNHLLQGKVQSSLEMGMRVLTNTLFGLGGLLDPATEMRLDRRPEDFGQTMGRWGIPNGPFVVLPLFGPSTVRDATGFVLDRQASATRFVDTRLARYSLTWLEFVGIRTSLLDTTTLVDQVALDKYSFIRDAYLSRRRDALFDGAPPMDTFEDEPADAPPPPAPAPPPKSAP